MTHPLRDQRPLFEPWFVWQELPDDIRQQALDVLTAIYLETVDPQNLEPQNDVPSER